MKKFAKIVLSAFVGGKWHEFVYTNVSVYDALELYGFSKQDVLTLVENWDCFYHPINLTTSDGQTIRMMYSGALTDYMFNMCRIGYEEYLRWMKEARESRDKEPYLYHVKRSDHAYCHDAYTSKGDALYRIDWHREEVLIRHGYTLVNSVESGDDDIAELWHHEDYGDVTLSLKREVNPTFNN